MKIESEIAHIDNLYSKEEEISIFRIIQEVVNNILKHSIATMASVNVARNESDVFVMIKDNGKGFDFGMLHLVNGSLVGFGLQSMRERMQMLGGTMNINSAQSVGTTIEFSIPIGIAREQEHLGTAYA